MNSRKDLIIKAGFGELSPDEQARLDALTPEEREQVEQVKMVRDGLKALRDVPECQMSSERLRDAILNQGVAPSRQSKPWTFAVFAAAAILVAYFGAQLDVLGEPDAVGTVGPDSGSVDFENVLPPLDLGTLGPVASNDDATVEDTILTIDPPSRDIVTMSNRRSGGSTISRNGIREEDVVNLAVPPWQYGSEGSMTLVSFDPQPDADVFTMFSADTGSQDDEYSDNLVVIDYIENPDTGAFVATEVETFGDVVFGG